MLKKLFSVIIVVLIFNLVTVAFVSDSTEKEVKFVEKIRSGITKLGTGPDAKIELKLKDGSKLKGYIKASDENQFVVVDQQGSETSVPYSKAKQVKGLNLNRGVYFVIGFVLFLIIVIAVKGIGS